MTANATDGWPGRTIATTGSAQSALAGIRLSSAGPWRLRGLHLFRYDGNSGEASISLASIW